MCGTRPGSSGHSSAARCLFCPLYPCLCSFFLLPLCFLLYVSLHEPSQADLYGDGITLRNYAEIWNDPFYVTIILRTLRTTFFIVVTALVVGYAAAYTITRIKSRWRVILLVVLLFPPMVTKIYRCFLAGPGLPRCPWRSSLICNFKVVGWLLPRLPPSRFF